MWQRKRSSLNVRGPRSFAVCWMGYTVRSHATRGGRGRGHETFRKKERGAAVDLPQAHPRRAGVVRTKDPPVVLDIGPLPSHGRVRPRDPLLQDLGPSRHVGDKGCPLRAPFRRWRRPCTLRPRSRRRRRPEPDPHVHQDRGEPPRPTSAKSTPKRRPGLTTGSTTTEQSQATTTSNATTKDSAVTLGQPTWTSGRRPGATRPKPVLWQHLDERLGKGLDPVPEETPGHAPGLEMGRHRRTDHTSLRTKGYGDSSYYENDLRTSTIIFQTLRLPKHLKSNHFPLLA